MKSYDINIIMKDYFTAKVLHLEDKCLISSAPRLPLLATYGVDNIIHTINPTDDSQNTYELSESDSFTSMTLAPDGSHCLLAKDSNIFSYHFESKELKPLS